MKTLPLKFNESPVGTQNSAICPLKQRCSVISCAQTRQFSVINVNLLMPIVVKVKTRTQGENKNNSDVKKKDRQSCSLPEPQRLRDQSERKIPNQDFPTWEASEEFELSYYSEYHFPEPC
jgi:mRNA deadenylase 3'-5' endonuclease subunit Ccr4